MRTVQTCKQQGRAMKQLWRAVKGFVGPHTDWFDGGVRGHLSQIGGDGIENTVACIHCHLHANAAALISPCNEV
eukprot:1158084-Pelagomonas_calceolata.AAC.21